MRKDRDWVDYVGLASNLTQNVQLHGVNSKLDALVQNQQSQASKQELKRQIQNHIWETVQFLENAKKQYADDPFWLALQLYACSIRLRVPITMCEDWEDKKRYQSLFDEVGALKEQTRAKLGEARYEDSIKCFRATSDFRDLEHYIDMLKVSEKSDKTKKRLLKELEYLKSQKKLQTSERKNMGFWSALRSSLKTDPLDLEIKEKELQIESNANPFTTISEGASELKEHLHNVVNNLPTSPEVKSLLEHYEKMDDFKQMGSKFEYRDLNQAIQYRTELLNDLMHGFQLSSLEEAEAMLRE
jgi:hypothetical protein